MARASFENFKICYREQKTVGNVTEEIWIFHFNPGKFLLDLKIRCVRNIFFIFNNNDFLYFEHSMLQGFE